jgi:hypothetical protein
VRTHEDQNKALERINKALEAKLEIAVKALEECRKTSKVSEPTIDKLIIRNITGLALSQIKEKASEG